MKVDTYDFVVVGAGIVGLTVSYELIKKHPNATIAVIEKEVGSGVHASGRNSGVLHSGIYYGSDTYKARVCAQGGRRMIEFAQEEGIQYSKCGKVILATSNEQLPTVSQLLINAKENNIPAEKIDNQQVKELEPYAADSVAAIFCPSTAVIDSSAVIKRLQNKLEQQGIIFHFGTEVCGLSGSNLINTTNGQISYGYLYNCAGAYADKIAKMFGLANQYELIPFKGIYWKLSKHANAKVKSNIYPVPDISLPFLGVHLTRIINGDVYIGPTAIPALGRENYGKVKGIKMGEALQISVQLSRMYLANRGNFRETAHLELAKYKKQNFLKAAQKLMPTLKEEDMVQTDKTGIRPQLVNIETGRLEMDYIIENNNNSLHVLNSISPAFTSSFEFAKKIVSAGGF